MITNHQLFGKDLVDFQYLLLDIQRYSEAELLGLSNTIGSVFLLEQKADSELLIARLRKLIGTIEHMPLELQQRFITWLTNIVGRKLKPGNQQDMEQYWMISK
ncbi:hypothetical protein [Paenibacillus agricola]|uniref:hypothetical protein n=1 Tax=Paenibacillus agricola TaxID=2716264 RepID=UPI001FB5AEBF|nr:hypothetical protein [Paenibacillus agricola]